MVITKNKFYLAVSMLVLLNTTLFSQNKVANEDQKMEWFGNAKLGIFIHWGIYSVNGIDESWSFYNGYISHADYLNQTNGFTAKNYNPSAWAKLIKESGAQYSVITAKHHDGFALWNSNYGNFNAVKSAASKKDVLDPLVKNLKKQGLKVGLYYSLPDWSYNDYTNFKRDSIRYSITDSSKQWSKFLDYYQGQLGELSKRYRPDLWWFDGDWEHSAEEWEAKKVRTMLLNDNPNTIINSRLKGHGDYDTPEQGMPITKPKSKYWELCMTTNDSWGYQKNDHEYKTTNQVIGTFADVISNGGNLLLDIGPKADGTIPDEQKKILTELGRWTNKHKDAIYNTKAGIPKEHFYGPTTLSKKGDILYLFVNGNANGEVVVRGLKNKINRIWVVGNGTKLSHKVIGKVYWSKYPGVTYIGLPEYVLDTNMTVLALLLDGPVDLYREDGAVIESN